MVIDKKIEIIKLKDQENFRIKVMAWLNTHFANQILEMQFSYVSKEYIVFIVYK